MRMQRSVDRESTGSVRWRWTRTLCVLASMLVALNTVAADEIDSATFRVATYNVNWGNRRFDQVLDAIKTSRVEVVFLQETSPAAERFLRQRLRASHPHFHAFGHEGRYAAERFVFASRFPLRNVAFHPPKDGLFGFVTAVCDFADGPVQLVNVHLTPFIVPRGASISEAIGALNRTEERHAAEIQVICRTLDLTARTIVAGDFNSLSTFSAPEQLRKLGLLDSFAAVHENPDAQPTWHWPSRPLPLQLRIDYVFHTRHFQTVSSRILRRPGSDHSLVVSELRKADPEDSRAPDREVGSNGSTHSPGD